MGKSKKVKAKKKGEVVRCVRCKRRKATIMKEVMWYALREYVEVPICDKCNT